jgi:SAM-dependent methyltransferase
MNQSDQYYKLVCANNPGAMALKIAGKAIRSCAEIYFHGKLLDVGCGTKTKKLLVGDLVDEYIGLDHKDSLHDLSNIDLMGTVYEIPVESKSFDCVLCTSVLEHLEEPELAIKECYRALKPGGFAIYSVPFIWHLHEEPRDFYRFTKYGLKYLFEKVGFEIIEIKALSGFWVTFGQLFIYNLYRFNRSVIKWMHIIGIISFLIQGIVYVLDKLDKTEQWTWMYIVIAKRRKKNETKRS